MSAKLRLWGRSASSVWMILAAAYAAFACSTTEVNGNDAGTSTSASTSPTASGTSSASGSSTSSVTSSSSTLAACVKAPAPEAGMSNLIASLCPADDSGAPGRFCFGSFAGYGGGTYFYPNNNGLVEDAGVDVPANPDAGVYCGTLASQNSFVAQPTTQGWTATGTVAGYSGVGIFFFHCVDASAYQGVQFTISGDVGNAGSASDASDAGAAANQLSFSVANQDDLLTDSGGNCTLGATCNQSTTPVDVTSTPTLVQIPWSQLMGGNPQVSDPARVVGIQWSWPWPCTVAPSVYTTNVVIQNISFY
jgi:hypothetical protein